MTACPNDETLGALVHRDLDHDELVRVTSHLDGCAACQEIVIAAVRGGVATPMTLAIGTPSLPPLLAQRVAPSPIGSRIGRYELRALLGTGGMGAVYDASHGELHRSIALHA